VVVPVALSIVVVALSVAGVCDTGFGIEGHLALGQVGIVAVLILEIGMRVYR
jgi:hypothetical protein